MHQQSSRGAHDTEPGGPALSGSRKRHLSPVAVPVAPSNQPGSKWGPSSAGTKPKKPKTVIADIVLLDRVHVLSYFLFLPFSSRSIFWAIIHMYLQNIKP